MKVELKKLNNKICYYQRTEENEDLTYYLDDLLRIERRVEEVKIGNETFYKNCFNHKLMSDQFYVYLPISIIDYLKSRCNEIGFDLELSNLELHPIGLDIESKIESLSQIYGDNSDKIIDLLSDISTYRNGLINLYTGWGKTWAILGLAKSYLMDYTEGKVCILAQGAAVVDEIRSRLPLFQIDPNRIIIENTASVRSQRFYADWWKDERNSIDLVIIDEADSITDTLKEFLEILPNYRFIFGFTATPDAYGGQHLNWDTKIEELKNPIYRILHYIGMELSSNSFVQNVNLKVIDAHFSDKKPYMKSEYKKFRQAVEFVIESKKFIQVLEYVVDRAVDTIYLPINNKQLIYKLMDTAKKYKSKLDFIYWDAGSIWTTEGHSFRNHVELNDYLATTPMDKRPRILLSTRASYRGVSLPNLTDILLVENSNFRNVPQSFGRCFRAKCVPTVWVPRETDKDKNLLFFCMATKRLKIINQTYKNINREIIKL